MASKSTNISPLQYPQGTPIKGAVAMAARHNWDAINRHIQGLQQQIDTLQSSLDALGGTSTATGVSSLQTRTGSLTLTSTGASVTITSPTASTVNLESSGGGGSPGGADTNVQFNNSGAFGGDGNFTWNSTTKRLIVGGTAFPGIGVTNGSETLFLIPITTANGIFTGTAINDATIFNNLGTDTWIGNAHGYIGRFQDGGDYLVARHIQPGGLGTGGTYKSQDGTSGYGGNSGLTAVGVTYKDGIATAYSPASQSNTSVPGGNTIANTTTATAFTSTGTVAANTAAVGNVYRLTLYGVYSTAVLAPTLNLSILLGSTVVCTSSSITTIGGLTNDGFRAECLVIVNTAGASGVVEAQGNVLYGTAATTALTVLMANTATISGIDFTASNNFSAQITWGTASASNTITLRQFVIEKLS